MGSSSLKLGSKFLGLRVGERGTWDGGLKIQGSDILRNIFHLYSKVWVPIRNYQFDWQLSTKSARGKPVSCLRRITSRVLFELKESYRNSAIIPIPPLLPLIFFYPGFPGDVLGNTRVLSISTHSC